MAAALVACLSAWPASAEDGRGAPSPPLELIVKFSRDSDTGRRVERLLREGSQDLGGLAEAQAQLEKSIGIALERERITSGREILFSIPERPLLETVEASAARRPDVASTAIETLQAGNPRLPEARLVIRFVSSSEAYAALERADDADVPSDSARTLAKAIGASSGVPVAGVAQPHGALALTVDRQALLATLSARIGNLEDVDYAQPNAPMQIMK